MGVNKISSSLATHQSLLGHYVQVWGITPSPEGEYPGSPIMTHVCFSRWKNKFRIDQHLSKPFAECPKETVFHLHGGFILGTIMQLRLLTTRAWICFHSSRQLQCHRDAEKSSGEKRVLPIDWSPVVSAAKLVHFLGKTEYEAMDESAWYEQNYLFQTDRIWMNCQIHFIPLCQNKRNCLWFLRTTTTLYQGTGSYARGVFPILFIMMD